MLRMIFVALCAALGFTGSEMLKQFACSLAVVGLAIGVALSDAAEAPGASAAPAVRPAAPAAASPQPAVQEPSRLYVLKPNDTVLVKVYQEDDLTATQRIARDGTINLPLLGTLVIGSNTVEQAKNLIQLKLAKDYLVNPQVTLSILEYGKRRFTVLGQANQPGTYEMPSDDKLTLLQAIAMARGYTKIGNPHKITVQRTEGDQSKIYNLDAKKMAEDKKAKPFEILPDDIITIGESWI